MKNKVFGTYKIYIFLFAFIINVSMIWVRQGAMITDETNPMALAMKLCGNDWSTYMISDGYYYKYGQLLLFFLPISVCNSSKTMFWMMLVINSLITSFIPIIVYRISDILGMTCHKTKILVSILIGTLPEVLLSAKLVWAEPFIILMAWINLMLIIDLKSCLKNSRKYIYILVLLLAQTYSCMIHTRGMIILICTFVTTTLVLVSAHKQYFAGMIYVFGTMIFCGIEEYMSGIVKYMVYGGANNLAGDFGNESILSIIPVIFTKGGFFTFISEIIGALFAANVGTLGLLLLGVAMMIMEFKKVLNNKLGYEVIIMAYASMLLCASLAIGGLLFFDDLLNYQGMEIGVRGDKLLYSRYILAPTSIICFYGIYNWMHRCNKTGKTKFILLMIFMVINMWSFIYILPRIDNTITWAHTTMAITYFCDFNRNIGQGFYSSIYGFGTNIARFAVVSISIFSIFLLIKDSKKMMYIYIVLFIILYVRNSTNALYAMDRYVDNKSSVSGEFYENVKDIPRAGIYVSDEIYRSAFRYRYPDISIWTDRDDSSTVGDNVLFVGMPDINNTEELYKISEVDSYNTFYVMGEELKKDLFLKGYKLEGVIEKE